MQLDIAIGSADFMHQLLAAALKSSVWTGGEILMAVVTDPKSIETAPGVVKITQKILQ